MSNITTRAGKGSRLTWNEVDANFNNLNSDKLDKVETADQTINSNLQLNKATATSRFLSWLTGGVLRWKIESTSTAESGSNAGSDFVLRRYADNGTLLDNPIVINRASGNVDFSQTPTTAGVALVRSDTVVYVKRAGDSMTGLLTLSADPTSPLHAATKQYADKMLPLAGGTMNGAANIYYESSTIAGAYAIGLHFRNSNVEKMGIGAFGNALDTNNWQYAYIGTGATPWDLASAPSGVYADYAGTLRTKGTLSHTGSLTTSGAISGAGVTSTAGVVAGGKVTSLTAGAANGEGVEFAQLNAALAALSAEMIGQVSYFAMNAAPTKFVECAGQALARTGTYAALFAKIGTTFGAGDGSTTFNVPDLRGEFIRGWDHGRGVDASRAFASAQGFATQAHQHWRNVSHSTEFGYTDRANNAEDVQGRSGARTYDSLGNQTDVQSTGVSASETRPRNVALLPCIRYA